MTANNSMNTKRGGPLQGVRVVELTKVWAGPYTGKLLAFLGAEVIRIESEKSLDVTRVYGVDDINNAPGFKSVNPQKLSVQIDMKSERGIALLLDLIKESDVLIENLRPGAVKRLGLDYERVKTVKNDIIYTSMGMYGNEGPLSYQTGYAPCFAALSGLSSLVGYPDSPPAGMNVRYADSTFGAAAAYATLVALYHKRKTGEGQYVDVSAVETMTSMVGDTLMDFTLNGIIQTPQGNAHTEMAPHGVYPCANGEWISIAIQSDSNWQSFAETISQSESTTPNIAQNPLFSTLTARKQNESALNQHIEQFTSQHNADDLVERLQKHGIAAAKSASSLDLIADSHLWARSFYQEVSNSNGESQTILGPGWKMTHSATINRGAPRLGEHNDYVFSEILGLTKQKQAELAESGVTK